MNVLTFLLEPPLTERKEKITEQFLSEFGHVPDFDTPKSFNEKLQWLKLNLKSPLITQCADKYRVREYVKNKIGKKYLIKLLSVYDTADEIDFTTLPESFALKVNWGSGQNIICKDKASLNQQETKEKLNNWLLPENNHYYFSYEWCYKNIQPKIICEKYIEQHDNKLLDYKFFCYNGKVKNLYVAFDRFTEMKWNFYDTEWNLLPFHKKYYANSSQQLPKPSQLDEMICLAEKLSNEFIFSRVDFFIIDEKIKFSEITFFPCAGIHPFVPADWDNEFGNMLRLPVSYDFFVNGYAEPYTNLTELLIQKENQFGGLIHRERQKVSKYDLRDIAAIAHIPMQGGDRMSLHGYAPKYAYYLQKYYKKNHKIIIAEVGILAGTGLATWCDLFPTARVLGFDIDLNHFNQNYDNLIKAGAFSLNKPEVYEFDQFDDNTSFVKNILRGKKITICIDDGVHSVETIMKTFCSMRTHLAEEFVYFIEDNMEIYDVFHHEYPELNIESCGELTIVSRSKNVQLKNKFSVSAKKDLKFFFGAALRFFRKIQFKISGTQILLHEMRLLREQLNQVNEHIGFVDKQNEVTREQLNQVHEHISFVDKQNEVTREQLNQVNEHIGFVDKQNEVTREQLNQVNEHISFVDKQNEVTREQLNQVNEHIGFLDKQNANLLEKADSVLNISLVLPNNLLYLFQRINSVYMQNLKLNSDRQNVKVVYTCITENYDDILIHSYVDDSWDYICFTDNEYLISLKKIGMWKILPLVFSDLDSTRNNRWHKLHPHIILSNYSESIYIDPNIDVKTSYLFQCINQKKSEKWIMAIPPHFDRKCLYDEAGLVKSGSLENAEIVDTQISHYKSEGFPENYGLTENSIIYRIHNESIVQKIMDDWWSEIEQFSKRDQLSLFYVLWKNNFEMSYLTEIAVKLDTRNFDVLPHGKKQKLTLDELYNKSRVLKV